MEKSLGSRLREIRGDISQCELSRKIGVKQTTYSSWERGIKEPSYDVLCRISRQFGVSADWLLCLSDDRTGHAAPVSDAALVARVAELEREADRLRAENAGLKYALDALGKGATVGARPTALATGA